jgi:hypothetical protein
MASFWHHRPQLQNWNLWLLMIVNTIRQTVAVQLVDNRRSRVIRAGRVLRSAVFQTRPMKVAVERFVRSRHASAHAGGRKVSGIRFLVPVPAIATNGSVFRNTTHPVEVLAEAVRVVVVVQAIVVAVVLVVAIVDLRACHLLWPLPAADKDHAGVKDRRVAAEEKVREEIQAVRRIRSKTCDPTDPKSTFTLAI